MARTAGQGDYAGVMVAHDESVGQMLAKLDEFGIVSHQNWLTMLLAAAGEP